SPFKAVHDELPQRRNAERDLEDFEAAIKDGSIQPPDPETARTVHKQMRGVVGQLSTLTAAERETLPAEMLEGVRKREFPSEFADYHEGAIAYAKGDHAGARAAWKKLLARPKRERPYRSVHAAFMIGVLATVDETRD